MNVPKLRFSEFNDEWNYNRLDNYVERVVRKNKNNESNLVLTISAQFGLVDQKEFFNRNVSSSNLTGYYLLNNGEFAYNKSYSNGYPWGAIKRLNKYNNGVVSSLYICFKTKNNINSEFLEHYFETNKWFEQISEVSVEGARNHGLLNIAVNDFFGTEHFFPSIKEQEKIGNMLSLLDKKIELQSKKIEDLKLYKISNLKTIFKREKFSKKKMKQIGTFITSNPLGKDILSDSGTPIILYGDLYTKYNEVINNVNSYTSLGSVNLVKSSINDLIFPTSTTVDSISLIAPSSVQLEGVIYGGDLAIFKPYKNVNSEFLSYEINHILKKEFSKKAKGSTIIHIQAKDLLECEILMPLDEAKSEKISNLMNCINYKIELESEKLIKLIQFKKGLMQSMFV